MPEDDDELPPRRRRVKLDDYDDDDEYADESRPRRRRPPPSNDAGLGLIVPINTPVLAILASYAGLFSVLCFPAPFALLLGVLALMQLKKNPKQSGHGRAWFAIVMGAIGSLILLIGVIGAIAGSIK